MIQCVTVSARVGSFELRDVSFTVPAGAHAMLAGPTAAGKSTLLELIAGATAPTAGRIMVGGNDVSCTPPELRATGMVPQHGYLFPHLDVHRNIAYGAKSGSDVAEVARRFGIDHLMPRGVASLSGGERQLVALSRALASLPSVLLLDEPLSALDPTRRHSALRELLAFQHERRITVLHVTHQDSDAEFGDLWFQMSDGRLSPSTANAV